MRLMLALALTVGLATPAFAGGGKVDWSQYMETPADRAAAAQKAQVAQKASRDQAAKSEAKPAKVAKAPAKAKPAKKAARHKKK